MMKSFYTQKFISAALVAIKPVKRFGQSSRVLTLALFSALVLQACPPVEEKTVDETPAEVSAVTVDSVEQDVSFDPLGAVGDLTIVPETLGDSVNLRLSGSGDDSTAGASLSHLDLLNGRVDSTGDTAAYDTYRIQLYNSRAYTEAALEKTVATEIFDYAVTLDYEVPYFKVRIGDFQNARVAEDYLKDYVKPAGYPDSWVARVRVTPQKSAAAQAQLTAYFDSLRTAIMLEGMDIDALDSLGVLDSLLNDGALDSSAIDSLLHDSSATEGGDE